MEPSQTNLEGIAVLIVEDEALVAFALQTHLLKAGARNVETARTLAETEEVYARDKFDVVVLDVRLPDGEAYHFARALVEQKTPVVIHSGHASVDDTEGLKGALFCSKPAMPAEVLATIEKALAQKTTWPT